MISINLKNKTAIVTGAGRGLGEAIVRKLADAGAAVVVSDLSLANAEQVAAGIRADGGQALAVQTDVTREEQLQELVDCALKQYGSVDILINNAGISIPNFFLDSTVEELDKTYSVNLKGAYLACQAALPPMIEQGGGVIINIASTASRMGPLMHATYGATKWGILGMTQVICNEYGAKNIRANCICPGIIKTELWDGTIYHNGNTPTEEEQQAFWARMTDKIPMRRLQTAEDMANAALFLASDLAQNITGQALNVNGGQVCN